MNQLNTRALAAEFAGTFMLVTFIDRKSVV